VVSGGALGLDEHLAGLHPACRKVHDRLHETQFIFQQHSNNRPVFAAELVESRGAHFEQQLNQ